MLINNNKSINLTPNLGFLGVSSPLASKSLHSCSDIAHMHKDLFEFCVNLCVCI